MGMLIHRHRDRHQSDKDGAGRGDAAKKPTKKAAPKPKDEPEGGESK